LIFGKDIIRNWAKYDKEKDPVFNSRISAGG